LRRRFTRVHLAMTNWSRLRDHLSNALKVIDRARSRESLPVEHLGPTFVAV